MELTLQATEFEAQSRKFGDPEETVVRTLPLRLVSAHAAMFFNAMRQADRAYARTNWAVKQQQLTFRGQNEMADGFEATYGGLKKFLFGESSEKTAGEIGREMGIA